MAVDESSDESSPFNVSEDLVPPRPAKAAGATTVTFDGQLDPPLVVHEDLKEGCGGQLWPAGTCLTEFLLRRREEWQGKIVYVAASICAYVRATITEIDVRRLELGAGGGLVGLGLALANAQEQHRRDAEGADSGPPICITDLPQLLPLQKQNIALNSLSEQYIKSCCLPWGSPPNTFLPPAYRRPEVILAADCVYYEPAFPLLLQTLETLMRTDDDTMDHRDPVCWFCMKKRRKADMRFVTLLRKRFQLTEIELRKEDREQSLHL